MLLNLERIVDEEEFSPRLAIKDVGTSSRIYHSLPVAVYTFLTAENFEESVLNAVNLGGDADSIGAFSGGLMGASVGYGQIPERFRGIRNFEYLQAIVSSVATKSVDTPTNSFIEREGRLTFEETAMQMHIKRMISRLKRHSGIRTKVNGHEIRQLAEELGIEIQDTDIGQIKRDLRDLESKNSGITREEERDYIRKTISS